MTPGQTVDYLREKYNLVRDITTSENADHVIIRAETNNGCSFGLMTTLDGQFIAEVVDAVVGGAIREGNDAMRRHEEFRRTAPKL